MAGLTCDPNYLPSYCRDDNYEHMLHDNLRKIRKKAEKYSGDPISTPVPSHWEYQHPDLLVNEDLSFFTDPLYFTPNKFTAQHAIEYLQIAGEYIDGRRAIFQYHCQEYPRDTSYCQHLAQINSGGISKMINNIRNSIELVKQKKKQREIDQRLREEQIQAEILKEEIFEKEKEEEARIAKRNKTLLLIGSIFLLG